MCFVNRDYSDVRICMRDFNYCVNSGHYYGGGKKVLKIYLTPSGSLAVILNSLVRVFLSIFIRWLFHFSLEDV